MKQFWDWYIGLYHHSDPKVVVATIAMSIAALTFIINYIFRPLYKILKRETASVSIEAFHSFAVGTNVMGTMVSSFSIELVITNKSKHQLYLNNPLLETPKQINGAKRHYIPAVQGTYPTLLQSGQQHKRTYNANNNIFNSLRPEDKVRYVVTDTISGTYYSKYYKVKDFR